jgi:hypothetical protein
MTMQQRFLMAITVFICSIIFVGASTWAAEESVPMSCEQSDLAGTWSVRVGAKDEFGDHLCWESCDLIIDSAGIIEQAGTFIDCLEVASDITGGQLTLFSDCVIEGYIETSNSTVYILTGAIFDNELALGRTQSSGQ